MGGHKDKVQLTSSTMEKVSYDNAGLDVAVLEKLSNLNGSNGKKSKSGSRTSPRIKRFGQFSYPTVCTICHSLWDRKGNVDLVTPCGCSATSLHVHETCLNSWLQHSGKIRCEVCKTEYSNSNIKHLKSQLTVQRANLCIIVVFMPVGVILVVGFCLIIDSVKRAMREREETGLPNNGFGMATEVFIFLCIFFGVLIIATIWMSVAMLKGKKSSTSDDLTLSKA